MYVMQNIPRRFNGPRFNDEDFDAHISQTVDDCCSAIVAWFMFQNLIRQDFFLVGFNEAPEIGRHALFAIAFGRRAITMDVAFVIKFFAC